jgi:hypothetical protein
MGDEWDAEVDSGGGDPAVSFLLLLTKRMAIANASRSQARVRGDEFGAGPDNPGASESLFEALQSGAPQPAS